MRNTTQRQYSEGFLMMEVVLALGIFAIAATAFTVALGRTSDAASMAQRRMQIGRILESSLTEAMSMPTMEEGMSSVTLDEEIGGAEVEVDTLIEPMLEMENQDGNLLQQMFRVEVSAHWYENGEWMKETAETWRYARLYQP